MAWLERSSDVRRARAALPTLRCTLLRPGSWAEPLRSMYFTDAQQCGAKGVSLQPGAIAPDVVAQAKDHGLVVFTRIDNVDHIGTLVQSGVGGLITNDPTGTRGTVARIARD